MVLQPLYCWIVCEYKAGIANAISSLNGIKNDIIYKKIALSKIEFLD